MIALLFPSPPPPPPPQSACGCVHRLLFFFLYQSDFWSRTSFYVKPFPVISCLQWTSLQYQPQAMVQCGLTLVLFNKFPCLCYYIQITVATLTRFPYNCRAMQLFGYHYMCLCVHVCICANGQLEFLNLALSNDRLHKTACLYVHTL